MFLTPSLGLCVGPPKGTPKIKKRAPRCMGMLRQKIERAPRCMGTLFVFSWSGWVPPRAPQAIAPNIHFQIVFLLILFFGIHLVVAPGVVTPGGGGRGRTHGRTDACVHARTHARTPARRPTPLHNAHRKKIRRSGRTPPHSDLVFVHQVDAFPYKIDQFD